MNREFKFRVWHPELNKFVYFGLGSFDYSDRYLSQYKYPVQQFTGIYDRTGKEIYEGDIVKYSYKMGEGETCEDIGEVFFERGIFYFGKDAYLATNDWNLLEDTLLVTGNIFDHHDTNK